MAIGFGPGKDMLKTVKSQRKHLKGDKKKTGAPAVGGSANANPNHYKPLKFDKKATPEMLAEIRTKRQQKQRDQFILTIVIFVVLCGLIYFVI
ncbi:hypothetical protein K6119_05185 [Paracrocinitomix mangrovi]|uniref:hypothetical protein n=1 Tax=Paracrocinitomix mangrovi TaxID=2862509 RepID=UPI001C8D7EDD|nr:hypothetical protein [Paracrocinitomix mangrovi]UKN02907.1 hypothetical protein K6119_05185 [Paracrocinitomix mangrovi]